MKHRRVAIVATVCAGLTITGCVSAPPEQGGSSAPTAASAAATVWKVKAELVGSPVIANGTIVSFLRKGGKLQVGAWNLADGKKLWTAAAVTSGETPGIELGVRTVTIGERSFVAYLTTQRGGGTWRELTIADVRTGPDRKLKPIVVWPTTHPTACGDGKAFCMTGYRVEAWKKRVNLRIDPVSRSATVDDTDGIPNDARRLGYSIYASDARPPHGVEQLGSFRDGKIVWERAYPEVFGNGASSDDGWAWKPEKDGVVVGVGYTELCHTSKADGETISTCEDTTGRLVGLNSATGATIWSLDRVDGCQGQDPLIASTEKEVTICRNLVGNRVFRKQGSSWKLLSSTYEQELVVLDRQVGTVLWRVPLGKTIESDDSPTFVNSDTRLVLTSNGQLTVFDTATRTTTPVTAETALMCRRDRPTLMLHWLDDDERYDYSIGQDIEPCDASGKPIAEIAAAWVPSAGVDAGEGRWLLPTPGSLTLVRLT